MTETSLCRSGSAGVGCIAWMSAAIACSRASRTSADTPRAKAVATAVCTCMKASEVDMTVPALGNRHANQSRTCCPVYIELSMQGMRQQAQFDHGYVPY